MRVLEGYFRVGGSAAGEDGRRYPTRYDAYFRVDALPDPKARGPYRRIALSPGRRGTRALYFREEGGVADFFLHDPGDEAGFGGSTFSGTLDTGESFSVRGPWSSSCAFVNSLGLPAEPLGSIAATASPSLKSYDWRSLHVSLSVLRQAAELFPDWRVVVPPAAPTPPYAQSAADEQLAVLGERRGTPYFAPIRDPESCPDCSGKGSVPDAPCVTCAGSGKDARHEGARCFRCSGRGHSLKECARCNRSGAFCYGGFLPYPGLMWVDGSVTPSHSRKETK